MATQVDPSTFTLPSIVPLSTSPVVQAFIRLGALPAAATDVLAPTPLVHALKALDAAQGEATRMLAGAVDELYEAVGTAADAAERNKLLAVRRDLFNGRALRAASRALLDTRADLPRAQAAARAWGQLERERASVRAWHAEAMRAGWSTILRLSAEPSIEEGIALASNALASGLAQIRRAGSGARAFGSRDQQVLRGALRYISRASRKATPFATFCLIADLRLLEDEDAFTDGVWRTDATTGGARKARLNKKIFGLIWARLKGIPEVRRQLRVELNPTVESTATHLTFLTSYGRREVFQRLERTPELDEVFGRLMEAGQAPLADLALHLCGSDRIDASTDEAEAYLGALAGTGLLRFISPVAQFDADWEASLAACMEGMSGDVARAVHTCCREAIVARREIAARDATTRRQGLARLAKALEDVASVVGAPGGWPHNLTYEDRGAPFTVSLSRAAVQSALARLNDLAFAVMRTSSRKASLAGLRDEFEALHPALDASIPLLPFFEAVERRRKARRDAARAAGARGPVELPVGPHEAALKEARKQVRERWIEAISRAWNESPDAVEIHIDSAPILATGDDDPELTPSLSVFCNLVPASDATSARAVAPNLQVLPGLGKYFSRFLHVLPDGRSEELRAANRRHRSTVLAEIAGDEDFNANLHPPLLDHQLAYPAGDGDGTADERRVSDLLVTRHPTDAHALVLVDRATGERVVPVDLGFLNGMMRPPLYRMLMQFSPAGGETVPSPSTPHPDDAGRDRVLHRPRIVVDGAVVIARRSWRVPYELFPAQVAGEPAAETFLRIHAWRTGQKLPDRLYLRVFVRPKPSDPTAKVPDAAEAAPGKAALTADEPVESPHDEMPESAGALEAAVAHPTTDAAPAGEIEAAVTQPRTDAAPAGEAARVERQSRDLVKPQFLDLRSPVFVDLLVRLAWNTPPHDFLFEEEYPSPAESPTVDGEARVAECLVQFHRGIA